MPGKELKGRSKRAMYSNGKLVGGQKKLDVAKPKGVLNAADFKALGNAGSKAKTMRTTAMAGGMMRKKVMGGGSMMRDGYSKGTHVTKDGRTVQKGLYYNMNQAKKKGTSKPGKGSVTDKALKQSAKTAFKG